MPEVTTLRSERLEPLLGKLDAMLVPLAPGLSPPARAAVERWRADAAALRFHLRRGDKHSPRLVAVVGGTGTGKSTLVNRLLGRNLSAASFKRTFTSGPVAAARRPDDVPDGWLGIEHVAATEADLPARGRAGALVVVTADSPDGFPVLVDTPDLDGDQPAHHAQADRAFRWADAVLFLVTPEKYQMTELLPYYRLASRYGAAALYVMNKCEEAAVVEDYRRQLRVQGSGFRVQEKEGPAPGSVAEPQTLTPEPSLFAVPRDDSAYQPPPEANLDALRAALASPPAPDASTRQMGLRHRALDLLGRLSDQVIAPLREDRREADRLAAALRSMERPMPGVDVNPLTQQLQRRMQQRSILYLMGPQRILDRVRQTPALLMRLPRVAWDYVKTGEISAGSLSASGDGGAQKVPDFRAVLIDQFAVLQSRIDDALRSSKAGERWLTPIATSFPSPGTPGEGMGGGHFLSSAIEPSPLPSPGVPGEGVGSSKRSHGGAGDPATAYAAAGIDSAEAGKIADEELAALRDWLEKRWNATPRDTKALETLLRYLPGGTRLAKWSEAAPYLLTLVLALIHLHLSGLDLMVLGGYGLATWLTEKLSNEVTARTRETNARIATRFARLAHDQIERTCAWLDQRSPPTRTLDQLERTAHDAAEMVG